MRNIRSTGTVPEKLVMRELRRQKIYFAKYVNSIIGKPDIVFRRKRVVVFIDSVFWHGHPEHFIIPKTDTIYWSNKILRNKERDYYVTKELRSAGWRVIRIWDHDIKNNLDKCIETILRAIDKLEM